MHSQLKITPDLIPHKNFHKGKWLLPIKRPNWYYFKKGKNKNTISNTSFLHSIDKPLKELVKFLHKKGIKTTPSCAGHHISEKNFEKIYTSLKKDKKDIRKNGLLFKDCETGKIYIYKNKNYILPWTKKKFLSNVMNYQKQGVIGLKLKNKKWKEEILNLNIPNVKIKERDFILLFFVNNKSGNNSDKWKKITKKVKRIIKEKLNNP
jgi:hypothetical protein